MQVEENAWKFIQQHLGHELVSVQGDGSCENVEESKEVHKYCVVDVCGLVAGGVVMYQ